MSKLLIRHGLSEANDRSSAAFGMSDAQLLPQGIEHARSVRRILVAHYGLDPEQDSAAASLMLRSQQTAQVVGFKVVSNYAILNEVEVPKTPELRTALDSKAIVPEARDAAEAVLANPPKEDVWFTHGYLIAAVCELTGFEQGDHRFIPKFGEVRELEIN